MKQIAFALALIACAPAAWAAEKLSLTEISGYLNGLKTAQTSFTQINDDGSLSTGRLYIHRPGRMRFEYDPPDFGTVVAGAGAVAIFDKKSNQPPETYPLRRTPLSVILARRVDLKQANMVVGHGFDGTTTVVQTQDPEHPDYGSLELMFTSDPVELRKWVVHDNSGGRTTVILGPLETGMQLPSKLFDTSSNRASR
ncbi:LolA family protein [Parasedimentitalea psychrophila]|uniref:Outer membrane lipoprotein carrier protein LolA n=1 Tax=Parasedimentitalea psychrophila TaxID=2997337 RepID=A0A9Y2L3N7_9RHOB|nr:outer membrane lipoprotein carrier protein LolA [Parasedimentitalea psychrophila]WIY26997.1 outer membrane lipoprotein carrier protein LolA [Parasedimentitalea psychrophila]